jgi:tetratricopeptide (TPR) repeat protein
MASIEDLTAAARQASAAGDFTRAEQLTRQALRVAPADAELWSLHADALDELGRIAESAAAFQRAVALDPANPARTKDYAMNRLKLGFLAEGFRAYEARLPVLGAAGGLISQFAAYRRWDGRTRERVMVCGEQGLGDQIMFARFIPRVAALASEVWVAVRPPLVRLFARHFNVVQPGGAGTTTATLPPFDSWIPVGSLPTALGCHTEAALRAPAYLTADPARVTAWHDALDATRLRVGIAWHGNPDFARNGRRSLPPALLEPLSQIAGVRFYGLQLPPDPAAPAWLDDLAPRIADFDDTAAILAGLDLLITTDTALPHLAGALGRPVWLMLSRVADWRWALEGASTPWYDSVRLFRQPAPGAWPPVIDAVAAALRALVAQRAPEV